MHTLRPINASIEPLFPQQDLIHARGKIPKDLVNNLALLTARSSCRIFRVHFQDPGYFRNRAGIDSPYFDILIMVEAFTDRFLVSLWIDNGRYSTVLAFGFSDTGEVAIQPSYDSYTHKPSLHEIAQLVFSFFPDNPSPAA